MVPRLSLLGVDIPANSISASPEYTVNDKVSVGVRIVYNDERAAALSLFSREWNQHERVREDMRAIGLGGSIPKKEHMRLSTILPATIELVHVNRQINDHIIQKMRTVLDNLTAALLGVHQMRCIFMYIMPASVQQLNKHPLCKALYAYAGDPSTIGSDLDAAIRRVLALRDSPAAVPSLSAPSDTSPFGLPPKPIFAASDNQSPSVPSTSTFANLPGTGHVPDKRPPSVPAKRPHTSVVGREDQQRRAKMRRMEADGVEDGEILPAPSVGTSSRSAAVKERTSTSRPLPPSTALPTRPASSHPSSEAVAQKLRTLQAEREAVINYSRAQDVKLAAAEDRLAAQQAQLAELEPLRDEVTRLRELSDDQGQQISTLSRGHHAMTEEIRVRGNRLKALQLEAAEVPGLRAAIQKLESQAAGADTLRHQLAELEPLRNVEAELVASRKLADDLRTDTVALVQQRDEALSDLSKAREKNDELQGQLAELESLRTQVQDLLSFRNKAKILLQIAQKLKSDHDELKSRSQQQENELQLLRRPTAKRGHPQEQTSLNTCHESHPEETSQREDSTDHSVLNRLARLVEHEGNFARDNISAVLEAVERKMDVLETVERTADTMCARALRAEKRIADLEVTLRALESVGPSMVPILSGALIQIADMASSMIQDI